MEIRYYMKNRRKELGLKLKDVANYVGVSEATVSRWESGDINDMKRERIEKLSEVLKISPAVLMGWESVEMKVENEGNIDSIIVSKIDYDFLKRYHDLTEEQKKYMQVCLEALAKSKG